MIRLQLEKAVTSRARTTATTTTTATVASPSHYYPRWHSHHHHHHHHHYYRRCQHQHQQKYNFHTQIIHWKKYNDGGGDHDDNNDNGKSSMVIVGRHVSFSPFLHTSSSLSSLSPPLCHNTIDTNNFAATTTVQALTVNDTTRASTAIKHLRNGHRLIYTGGDYHNARQLLRAMKHKITKMMASSSSSSSSSSLTKLHSPIQIRKRAKDCNYTQNDDDGENDTNSNNMTTHITQRKWIETKLLQRTQSEIIRGLLIQVSLEDVLCNNDNDTATSLMVVPKKKKEENVGIIMGLKRIPTNSKDVLLYAFQNEDRMDMLTKKVMTMPATTTTTSSTTMTSMIATTTNNSVDDEPNYLFFLSLSEFIGMIGGYEWYRKGVFVQAIQEYIYPHYGVFPPTRQDYIPLLDFITPVGKRSSMDPGDDGCANNYDTVVENGKAGHHCTTMLEVGIGSGMLSIILLKQGKVDHVTGTDINPNAIACSRDNMQRLGLERRVNLLHADLFPPIPSSSSSSTAIREKMGYDIVLFNPPWLPGDAPTYLDQAVYDPNQMVLRRFVCEVQHHVKEDGYVYILMSNLGMLLGLFCEQELHDMFGEGNLELVEVFNPSPFDRCKRGWSLADTSLVEDDEYHSVSGARAREVVSLYKLRVKRSR